MATTRTMARTALGMTLTLMALSGMASPGLGQAADKNVICHFQPETQSWTKLDVGGKAPAAHLASHDDATPGGTTSVTSTNLDANCQPVVCPCWTTELLILAREAAIARGDQQIQCGIQSDIIAAIIFEDSSLPSFLDTLQVVTTNGCHPLVTDPCCIVNTDESGILALGEHHIEGATFNACRQQIVEACSQ